MTSPTFAAGLESALKSNASTAVLSKLLTGALGTADDEDADEVKQDGLLVPGNIDLYNRPHVKNADGSISTVRSIGIEENGKQIVIPTVSPDGRILSNPDAIKLYHKTGQHLGIFDTQEHADAFGEKLHEGYAAGKYDRPEPINRRKPRGDIVRWQSLTSRH